MLLPMKRILFTLPAIVVLCLQSCNTKEVDRAKEKEEISVEAVTSVKDKIDASVIELEKSTTEEIIGLWKLYKTVYQSGRSIVERENNFLELKSNNKYETNRYEGQWFLSFYRDNGGGIATLLTKVMRWNGSYDAKVDVSKLEMINENNTTYLKLTDLSDASQSYYIRQQ